MRNFLLAIYHPYLIQCRNSRRKASMDTKDFVFNKCRQTQIVEYICAISPDIN
uniref:Uncharacterized protein n=1 Tax=Arundo donax TaxID=35708 RepID=A0A0A9E7N8_ARUDO